MFEVAWHPGGMLMATTAHNFAAPPAASRGWAAFIDKWIYVIMASWIMTIVLVGFIPDSIRMLAAIDAGQAAPIPPILHVHAVLMGSWITLLLAQAVLMATGRNGIHMQLGIAAFLLMPAIVIAGIVLVPVRHAQLYEFIATAPPSVAAQLKNEVVPFVTNIMLGQIRIGIMFPLLVGLALYYRLRDSETHKRLMILATIGPLPAAFDRMWYLPTTLPDSPLAIDLYSLLIAAPMIGWDLYRQKRLHRAYLIWLALLVPAAIVMNILWGTSWWLETGPKLVG
jgi:hypothetical protein